MSHPAIEQLKQASGTWFRARWSESKQCRDCDTQVNPLDEVCPGCGLANPARVEVSPAVWAGVGVVSVVALGLTFLT